MRWRTMCLLRQETEEQLERLEMAIDQLSGEEKALITLFYYEEKSMEEIGEVLKLSISNVKYGFIVPGKRFVY